MTVWQVLAHKKIDLSPLGLYTKNKTRYFCTPSGAKVLAHTGVDGNHYVSLGGAVYLVEPMDAPYVRPIAENETDFLRLLLACGGEWLVGAAHSFGRKEFEQMRRAHPADASGQAVLDAVQKALNLTPIDDPFTYLTELSRGFDPASIPFSREYYKVVSEATPAEESERWEVRFRDSVHSSGRRGRPGTEIPLNLSFSWQEREWLLLSAYLCGKGIVLDFAVKAEKEQIDAFLQKYEAFTEEEEENEENVLMHMKAEAEQPLLLNFSSVLSLNGVPIPFSGGSGTSYYPESWGGERAAAAADEPEEVPLPLPAFIRHYHLDPEKAWGLIRQSFLTPSRKDGTYTLSLSPEETALPAHSIHIAETGESFSIRHPLNGEEYRLDIVSFTPDEKLEIPPHDGFIFPSHAASAAFTLSPETKSFSLQPLGPKDMARREPVAGEAGVFSVIGAVSGPTAAAGIIVGGRDEPGKDTTVHYAFSNLTFEKADPEKIRWLPVFREKLYEDISLDFTIESE